MKKLLIAALLLAPGIAFAAISVPWNRTQVGTITPLYPVDGILVNASSTIGNGAQGGGLTVAGGATTTLNAYFAGKVGIGTTSPTQPLTVHGPLYVDGVPTNGISYTQFGAATLNNAAITNGTDFFTISTTTSVLGSIGIRAAAMSAAYTGAQTAQAVQGLNAFASAEASATGNLTATTNGGGLRNRYLTANRLNGYNVAQASAVSASAGVQGTFASTTDNTDFHAEVSNMAASALITNFRSFWGRAATPTGTITNWIGLNLEKPTGGTNNTEVLLGTPTAPTGSFGIYQSDTYNNYFAGKFGIGTTSPFAKLSVHANNGETNTTLFAVASSTATATTTLFSVGNQGEVRTGGGTPVITACGTGSPTAAGNDTVGVVTVGGGVVTACTVTYSTPKSGTPVPMVVVDGASAVAASISASSATAFTVTFAATLGGGTFNYQVLTY